MPMNIGIPFPGNKLVISYIIGYLACEMLKQVQHDGNF
jgi:hypothetical protein